MSPIKINFDSKVVVSYYRRLSPSQAQSNKKTFSLLRRNIRTVLKKNARNLYNIYLNLQVQGAQEWSTHKNGALTRMEHSQEWSTHKNGALTRTVHTRRTHKNGALTQRGGAQCTPGECSRAHHVVMKCLQCTPGVLSAHQEC